MIYIAGVFRGAIDLNPGVGEDNFPNDNGTYSMFVTKYESDGQYSWSRTVAGSPYGHVWANAIVTDSVGNIYVAGYFQYDVDFNPGLGTDIRTSIGGDDYDFFLSKYDLSGNYAWTNTAGGSYLDIGKSVAIGSDGVYMSGYHQTDMDFNPGAGEDTQNGNGSFITAYGFDGAYRWTRVLPGIHWDMQSSVSFRSGYVYVAGDFDGTRDFDPGGGTDDKTSAGGSDVFLSKFEEDGDYVWTQTYGAAGAEQLEDIGSDTAGSIYVMFHPDWQDTTIVKYGSGGGQIWSNTLNASNSDIVEGKHLKIDSDNNVLLVGVFAGAIDFNPSGGTDQKTANSLDAFISKYLGNGDYVWTHTFGGASSTFGTSITADSGGNIYAAGSFEGTSDFDPGVDVDNRTSNGSEDVFLSRFGILGGGGGGENGGGGGTNLDGTKYSYNYYPVNLDINATISLGCDGSVNMDAIVGTGKSDIALSGNNATDNMAMCNVKTNSSSGYKMEWNSSATHEASGALKSTTNASDTISPYSLSGSSETWSISATSSEWGAKIGASSEGYGTGNGGGDYSYASAGGWGTNDGYTNGKWMNVPTTPFQIMQKSTETDVDGEYQYLVFAAEIGADKLQPTGTYTQEVTVTATTL